MPLEFWWCSQDYSTSRLGVETKHCAFDNCDNDLREKERERVVSRSRWHLAATTSCANVERRGVTFELRGMTWWEKMWLLVFVLFCEIRNLGIEVGGCDNETWCGVEEPPARGMTGWERIWLLEFEFGVTDRLIGFGALFYEIVLWIFFLFLFKLLTGSDS